MSAVLRYSREQLLDALESRRRWAQQYDAKNRAEHKSEEAKALKDFRETLRAALKWDYETAKSAGRYSGPDLYLKAPRCPASAEATLNRFLSIVRATRQKSFVVSDRGSWSQLFWVLTHDETVKSDVC